MSKSWYVLKIYSQYENKVVEYIRKMSDEQFPGFIYDIQVPAEQTEVFDKVTKKKTIKETKLWPGYIFIEMDMDYARWKEALFALQKLPGVAGFLGAGRDKKPVPMTSEDMKATLKRLESPGKETVPLIHSFDKNDKVRIIEGPFASFKGSIDAIDEAKKRARVSVQIFGRDTLVDLDFVQIEKEDF